MTEAEKQRISALFGEKIKELREERNLSVLIMDLLAGNNIYIFGTSSLTLWFAL